VTSGVSVDCFRFNVALTSTGDKNKESGTAESSAIEDIFFKFKIFKRLFSFSWLDKL